MLLTNAVNTEGRPLEIYVKDGKIAAVGQDLSALAAENETVVDAGGLTVLPAFVDLHCHWRTPGFEYKEDIETGSRAAAAGGYTFVNLMPNTKPVCSSAAQAMMVEQKAAEVGLCDANQTVSITENFDGVSIDHLNTPPKGTVASAPYTMVIAPPQAPPIAAAAIPRTISFITIGIDPSTIFTTPIGTADFNISISSLL